MAPLGVAAMLMKPTVIKSFSGQQVQQYLDDHGYLPGETPTAEQQIEHLARFLQKHFRDEIGKTTNPSGRG
jgi:hypothetical protein